MRSRTLYHVSPAVNRASIAAHGLDPRRMGAARGIAGSERRELDGVFICHDLDDVSWFADMGLRQAGDAVDVWAIDDPGSILQTNTSGYEYLPVPVPPERVRLLETRTESSRPELPDALPELDGEMWAVIGSPQEVAAQLEELGVDQARFTSLLEQAEAEPPPLAPELAADIALVLRDVDRAGVIGDPRDALASDPAELLERDVHERRVELATAFQRRYVEREAVDGTLHPPCADEDHLHAAVAEVRDGAAWWVCPADGRALAPVGSYDR